MTEETLKKANDLHREIRNLEDCYKRITPTGVHYKNIPIEINGVHIVFDMQDKVAIINMAEKYLESNITNLKQQLAEL